MKRSISQKNIIEEKRVQVLLKEYELCTIDANHLEDSVWAATGILITASVAGIGFLGISVSKSLYDFCIRMVVAILSIIIILVWYQIVNRWYSIQHSMYYRTQEIEKELGMYKNLYIQSLDDQAQKKAFPDDQPFLLLIKEMAASHRGPTVRKSVPLIAVLLISSWIAFMILQLLVLLHVV